MIINFINYWGNIIILKSCIGNSFNFNKYQKSNPNLVKIAHASYLGNYNNILKKCLLPKGSRGRESKEISS